mgnify:FL=1
MIFPTKKRLDFDESSSSSTSSSSSHREQPIYLQANQQPKFDSNLFARQKTSKYSHPTMSVGLVPHKNPTPLQPQPNKENKVLADFGAGMFAGMFSKTMQGQYHQSETRRSTPTSLPYVSPLNVKLFPNSSNADLSQRSTAGSHASTGRSSMKSSQMSTSSTPTDFFLQKSLSPFAFNKGYDSESSKEKLSEQNKVNKLKKEAVMSPRSKKQWEELEKKIKVSSSSAKVDELIASYTRSLTEIPNRYWWKVFFDLAEVLKKECYYQEAKQYYKASVYLQPYVQEVSIPFSFENI